MLENIITTNGRGRRAPNVTARNDALVAETMSAKLRNLLAADDEHSLDLAITTAREIRLCATHIERAMRAERAHRNNGCPRPPRRITS